MDAVTKTRNGFLPRPQSRSPLRADRLSLIAQIILNEGAAHRPDPIAGLDRRAGDPLLDVRLFRNRIVSVMAAGSSLLLSLGPATPYGQVLLALVLLGAGHIAVITPVADIILSAVPRDRTGGAAAVNGAAMQIGGALGTAVLTSVLMAVGRAAYYQRLEPGGLSRQEIATATEALRRSIQKGADSSGLANPQPVRAQLADAYRYAFSVDAGAAFTCSALVCLLSAVLVWFGLKKISRKGSSSSA